MGARIHKLRLVPKPRNRSVIDTLKAVTQEAKAGDVAGVAIAILRPDGACNTTFSDSDQAAALMGAVGLLQHRLIKRVDNAD